MDKREKKNTGVFFGGGGLESPGENIHQWPGQTLE